MIPIFTFHTLDDSPSAIAFPPRLFERLVTRLHRLGYTTLRLTEAADRAQGGAPLPDRACVLTFDDGYRSVYEHAFPLLQRLGMTATVFLTTGSGTTSHAAERLPPLGGRPMLSWGEIRVMHEAGIDMGAHTLTHPDLAQLTAEMLTTEIVGSQTRIAEALGVAVPTFAYPFGRLTATSYAVVRRHFACACSTHLNWLTVGSDRHALPRLESYYLRAAGLCDLVGTPLLPWYIRARRIPRWARESLRTLTSSARTGEGS